MSDADLEQVLRLANQLSQPDRLRLFHHLSKLADNRKPSLEIQIEEAIKKQGGEDNDNFVLVYNAPNTNPAWVGVLLKGKTIFQILYYPENFRESRLKLRSWQHAPVTEDVKTQVREILGQAGAEVADDLIVNAALESQREIYEAETYRISKELALRLPDMVGLLVTAATRIIEISVRNTFAEQTGQVEKKTKLEDMEKMLEPFWKQIKERQLGVTHGGARHRKSKFVWDAERALTLYNTVEALPRHGADKLPMWEYAREVLRDNDYDHETIQFLKSRSMFADVQEDLLKEAATVWRQYDERWDTLPPENSPQAFAFRHACDKLDFPYTTYNTVRTNYYKGKKASEGKG